jgi:hypothetical protein
MVSLYFYKVSRETSSFAGKNLWTGWTLLFVFASVGVLGLIFSIWIISGRDEKREGVRHVVFGGVEKVQKAELKKTE